MQLRFVCNKKLFVGGELLKAWSFFYRETRKKYESLEAASTMKGFYHESQIQGAFSVEKGLTSVDRFRRRRVWL